MLKHKMSGLGLYSPAMRTLCTVADGLDIVVN